MYIPDLMYKCMKTDISKSFPHNSQVAPPAWDIIGQIENPFAQQELLMCTWGVKKDRGLFLFAAILKGQFPLKITKPSPPNDTPTLLALYVEMVLFYAIPPDI